MKISKAIIDGIKSNNKKDEDPEKMDFLMRTIKTVHSSANDKFAEEPEELEKHRASADAFSRLITPAVTVEQKEFEIDNIKCEWVAPRYAHRKDMLIMYCHGGGYISGGLGYAGVLASKLASHTGIEVVTFEYRLAPEHPYPAAIEDAVKVWDFLMHEGIGARNIILVGDSAGGNLALELCLELRAKERLLPRAMVLMSPWTDMSCTNNSYKTYKDKDPMLTYEYIISARTAYAGVDADYCAPEYSPLRADLTGMPPTLIQVGSNEILRDDSERLVKKYSKYGAMAKLEVYPGGWHVFQQMPIAKAGQALDNVKLFLDEIL